MADLTTQLGYPVDADELASASPTCAPDDHEVLVAVDATTVPSAGSTSRCCRARGSDLAIINGLVVDESARSAGSAGLVEAAERGPAARATAILVRSRSTRERAHRFYERIGYVEVKRSHVFEKPLV